MWHKARAQLSQMGSVGPTSLAGRPSVGAFSNSTLPMCQGRSVHEASNAQSPCGQETWPPGHPIWPTGLTSGPTSSTFAQSTDLAPL
jgi:hypothetical protein